MPVAKIEGTQIPTKSPADLSAGIPIPNQSATENRNDRKADSKTALSPVPKMEEARLIGIGSSVLLRVIVELILIQMRHRDQGSKTFNEQSRHLF